MVKYYDVEKIGGYSHEEALELARLDLCIHHR
jgi:hypothetical protein